MPNIIDANGLTIKTRDQIVAEILDGADGFVGLRSIYGADINVGPNTPDGQMVNIFAQATVDVLELLQQIYDGIDPDQAIGRTLDQRCAINGVVRKAGSYTLQTVYVGATQACTIAGLDTDPTAPFTVADAAGNRFLLVSSYVFVGAATVPMTFRAEKIGAIITAPNTITRLVTIQLGISSVNNPDAASTIGTAEETDYALRIRRAQSVSVSSKGYFQGLIGQLLAIATVTSVKLLENTTGSVDGNGIPGHSIWAIVNGGTDDEVAQAIYLKRNAGCGMKGAVSVNVTQTDGSTFAVLFDRPTSETLWISLDVTAITGTIDATYIRAQIVAALSYQIGQPADASAIVALVKAIAPNGYVSNEGVSNADSGYVPYKATSTVAHQWAVAPARIYINGSL